MDRVERDGNVKITVRAPSLKEPRAAHFWDDKCAFNRKLKPLQEKSKFEQLEFACLLCQRVRESSRGIIV